VSDSMVACFKSLAVNKQVKIFMLIMLENTINILIYNKTINLGANKYLFHISSIKGLRPGINDR